AIRLIVTRNLAPGPGGVTAGRLVKALPLKLAPGPGGVTAGRLVQSLPIPASWGPAIEHIIAPGDAGGGPTCISVKKALL
ncbi:hypothetical protein THAOC_18389, partial [Thalassiosira oceanica]